MPIPPSKSKYKHSNLNNQNHKTTKQIHKPPKTTSQSKSNKHKQKNKLTTIAKQTSNLKPNQPQN